MVKLIQDRFGLAKFFDGLPIVEAKAPLRVQPSKADIRGATKNDPENCVFSRACKRMWDCDRVLFLGTRAYVELLDKRGKRHVERFDIDAASRKMIKDFDAGKTIDPAGFVLRPPCKSHTLEGLRKIRAGKRKQSPAPQRSHKVARHARKPSFARLQTFIAHQGAGQSR